MAILISPKSAGSWPRVRLTALPFGETHRRSDYGQIRIHRSLHFPDCGDGNAAVFAGSGVSSPAPVRTPAATHCAAAGDRFSPWLPLLCPILCPRARKVPAVNVFGFAPPFSHNPVSYGAWDPWGAFFF